MKSHEQFSVNHRYKILIESAILSMAITIFVPVCFGLEITTRDGTTYKECNISRVEEDGIVITHSVGVARIPAEELPSDLQAKYHFDPEKVSELRNRVADDQAEAARQAAEEAAQLKAVESHAPKAPDTHLPAAIEAAATPDATPLPLTAKLSEEWIALPPASRVIAIIACGVFGLSVFVFAINFLRRRTQRKRICLDATKYLDLVESGHSMLTVPTNVMLKSDERAYYYAPASLHETRAVRHYQSGFAGFRVAKGIWIGGSRGRSVSSQELGQIDSGMLTVTTKRIVFDGTQNRTISLDKMISVKPLRDCVEVSVSNRQKSMFFTAANPQILYHIIRRSHEGWDTVARINHNLPLNEADEKA